ncbi:restriction endonuclease [Acetobacter pasteurianus NBRC 101655]|uniref:Restriction endonuclease type IV Mrr domain-containing protein n=1 Tax=Acetobacter ascendens TaxID=481146 RepID=A0A1Y0V1H8_9PROT|nr:restriction endonuclease [Acetobacter ascendens]ARW11835.1 hypothetical protein S101447_02798 [Acetobacter ascendens]BAU38711.1 restriction endonuclease [Acetobacter pasteurianus NBRC 101655]
MANDWKEYQEEAAEFFRSIGLKAETDVTLQGVRTTHDVDVYVQIDVAGFKVRWIVECKYWKSAVNKLHVMGLREIAADLGVDRGIILCESGFQSGAVEAASLTNVQVTSLEALGETSQEAIYAFRLRDLFDRTEKCRERYWDLPKGVRIEHGLRPDLFSDDTYSGQFVVEAASNVISKASRGIFPIESDISDRIKAPSLPALLFNYGEVVAVLEPLLAELESKLNAAAVFK